MTFNNPLPQNQKSYSLDKQVSKHQTKCKFTSLDWSSSSLRTLKTRTAMTIPKVSNAAMVLKTL